MLTLVTGATGFLGRHLVDSLHSNGVRLRALARPRTRPCEIEDLPIEIAWGDVMQPETLASAMRGVQRVYHTAAKVEIGSSRDIGMIRMNGAGTRNVLSAAWRAGVERVVYTSSVGAIGGSKQPELLTEDHIYQGCGVNLPYARSKMLADRIAMKFVARGLPLVPVYPTLMLGPGDRYMRSSGVIKTYLEGRALGYIAGGFGCTDVRDVAFGHLLAMERGEPGRRYILGGHNVTLRDLYRLLEQITGISAPTFRLPASLAHVVASVTKWLEPVRRKPPVVTHGDVDNARLYWFYNYARARDELGLVCRPLLDTLADTVDWLRAESRRRGAVPNEVAAVAG